MPFLPTNLRRVDFQEFFQFVAVRSFTADSSLLQPTGGVEHHTSHIAFSRTNTCTSVAQVVCLSCDTTTGLALWSSVTLETRSHPWVPAGHPQCTGAHHDGKAVDGPIPPQVTRKPLRT